MDNPHIHPATGNVSAIDISLCSSSLFLDIYWKVSGEFCESDHLPTFLHLKHNGQNDKLQRWQLGKADWSEFEQMCKLNLKPENFESLLYVGVVEKFPPPPLTGEQYGKMESKYLECLTSSGGFSVALYFK